MEAEKKSYFNHWPTMLLGAVVAIVFLFSIFTYQVDSTEVAVVTTFGKMSENIETAGLKFRIPFPIQKIYKYDNRLRCFDGNTGKLEETFTKDGLSIIIGVYAIYQITDPKRFFTNIKDINIAEDRLNTLIRRSKTSAIGAHNFSELVNTDPTKVKLNNIEAEMMAGVNKDSIEDYGITVKSLGIKAIGLPASITEVVSNRMKSERNVVSTKFREEGMREAQKIKSEADTTSRNIITKAQAQAKRIKAEGDAVAAKSYAAFRQNPQLAAFLMKLDALKKIVDNRTTIVLDTKSAPFDILQMDADKLNTKAKKR